MQLLACLSISFLSCVDVGCAMWAVAPDRRDGGRGVGGGGGDDGDGRRPLPRPCCFPNKCYLGQNKNINFVPDLAEGVLVDTQDNEGGPMAIGPVGQWGPMATKT